MKIDKDKRPDFWTKLQLLIEIVKMVKEVQPKQKTFNKPIRVVTSRLIKQIKVRNGKIQEKIGSSGTFVSTDLDRSPAEIIADYSKRFCIEEKFKDLKEICGLGKQQVRKLERNLTCIQMITQVYTLVEIWAWNKEESDLKSNRPVWDDRDRKSLA